MDVKWYLCHFIFIIFLKIYLSLLRESGHICAQVEGGTEGEHLQADSLLSAEPEAARSHDP